MFRTPGPGHLHGQGRKALLPQVQPSLLVLMAPPGLGASALPQDHASRLAGQAGLHCGRTLNPEP